MPSLSDSAPEQERRLRLAKHQPTYFTEFSVIHDSTNVPSVTSERMDCLALRTATAWSEAQPQ